MTVLKMLSKVIGAKEFLCLVAFAKFMDIGEVVYSSVPVRLWVVGELLAAEAAGVVECAIGSLG